MSTGVVGRDTELASVRGFVSSIPEGALALALEGEAGIGKTTLWQAGLDEAGDRAFRILVARPAESETALSFSGIGDLLDTVLDEALAALPAGRERRALAGARPRAESEQRLSVSPRSASRSSLRFTRCSTTRALGVVRSTTASSTTRASPGARPRRPTSFGPRTSGCSFYAVGARAPSAGASRARRRASPRGRGDRRRAAGSTRAVGRGGLAVRRPSGVRSERVGLLFSRRAGLDSLLVEELRRALPMTDVRTLEVGPLDATALHHVVQSAHLGLDPAETGSRRRAGRVRRQPVLRPRDRSHPAAQRHLRRSRATITRPRIPA